MDEDDNDELLQFSEDESITESEETCTSIDKPCEDTGELFISYTTHTKLEYFTTILALVLSSTILLVLLPIYQKSINTRSSAYTLVLFTSGGSFLIVILVLFCNHRFCPRLNNLNCSKPPLKYARLLFSTFVYTLSCIIIVYAGDRNRVFCHLQDPMKGLVLVFSLIHYFFFCKKLMGLQRIFSSTTVIIGLFISVDYSLCNEFRCRGYERENLHDDAGEWSWKVHISWAIAYICALAGFSAFYTLLERSIVSTAVLSRNTSLSSHIVNTISKLVSFQSRQHSAVSIQNETPLSTPSTQSNKTEYSALHLALWVQFTQFVFTICLFWLDVIPIIGNNRNLVQFCNDVYSGLSCVFALPEFSNASGNNCGNTSIYAWIFLLAYVAFVLSSLRFLIVCQSAVHTIASMCMALPLSGIWWALFKTVDIDKGLLIWNPVVSSDLICVLIGLPIVAIGQALLTKSHFVDIEVHSTSNYARFRHLV